MSHRSRSTWLRSACIAGLAFGSAIPARDVRATERPAAAAAADDLGEVAASFPPETLAIVAIPSLSALKTQFASTELAKILQEAEVRKFLEKPLAALQAAT